MSELKTDTDLNKPEIQKICESSLKDLLEFHKVEREEKFKTLQFYGLFLGGGLALVTSAQQLKLPQYFLGIIQLIAIMVILSVIAMAIRKLIAVRRASNRIYIEYTSRLRYLVQIELNKNSIAKQYDINKYFNYYFNEPKQKKKVLRPESADYFEIKILFWISIIFSLLSGLAIFNILGSNILNFHGFYLKNTWLAGLLAALIAFIHGILLYIYIKKWGSDLKEQPKDIEYII